MASNLNPGTPIPVIPGLGKGSGVPIAPNPGMRKRPRMPKISKGGPRNTGPLVREGGGIVLGSKAAKNVNSTYNTY